MCPPRFIRHTIYTSTLYLKIYCTGVPSVHFKLELNYASSISPLTLCILRTCAFFHQSIDWYPPVERHTIPVSPAPGRISCRTPYLYKGYFYLFPRSILYFTPSPLCANRFTCILSACAQPVHVSPRIACMQTIS